MIDDFDNYIKSEDCNHGFLYLVNSRNLKLGVYDKEVNGFIGLRDKFNSRFLFVEYHWDNESFATCQPLVELEQIPEELSVKDHLGHECRTCSKEMFFDVYRDKGDKVDFTKSQWRHREGLRDGCCCAVTRGGHWGGHVEAPPPIPH